MADKTYYFVEEKSKVATKEGRQYLTSNLEPIYKKHGHFFPDLESFTSAIADENVQRAIGVSLREATDADMKDFGGEFEIIDAVDAFKRADAEAAARKHATKRIVARYLSENVHTKDDLKRFFAQHKLNHRVVHSWIKTVHQRERYEMSDEAIAAFLEYVADKNKLKDAARKNRIKQWTNDFYTLPLG